jgi:hypothetical protein
MIARLLAGALMLAAPSLSACASRGEPCAGNFMCFT